MVRKSATAEGEPQRVRSSTVGDRRSRLSSIASYGTSQFLVFITALARIPLLVAAIGASDYGLLLGISALVPWMALILNSLTSGVRLQLSESLASDGTIAGRILQNYMATARRMGLVLIGLGVVIAVAVPWATVLGGRTSMDMSFLWSILGSFVLMASSTTGAVSVGLLHAERKVALAQALPGIGAVASLLATVVVYEAHGGFVLFVLASTLPTCIPFWFARVVAAKSQRKLLTTDDPQAAPGSQRRQSKVGVKVLLIMTGIAAPPLFSTGLDPIVLSAARGPEAVAAYGLALRLGLAVSMLPAALYPLLWAEFGRLRAAGDRRNMVRHFRREAKWITGGTALIGIAFGLLAPLVANRLGGGHIATPALLYWMVSALAVMSALQTVALPLFAGRRTAPIMAALIYVQIVPNEGVSFLLAKMVGPSGPLLASLISSAVVLTVGWLILRRDRSTLTEPFLELGRAPEPTPATAAGV